MPSKVTYLRELISQLSLSFQVQKEISDILDELEQLVYSLQEDNKRLTAAVRKHEDSIRSLEKRYFEILYKLSESKY